MVWSEERGGVSFPNTVAQIRRVREKSLVRNHACPTAKMSTNVVLDTLSVRTLPVRSFLQTWPKKKWQGSSSATIVARTKLVLLVTIHFALFPFLLVTTLSWTGFAW